MFGGTCWRGPIEAALEDTGEVHSGGEAVVLGILLGTPTSIATGFVL